MYGDKYNWAAIPSCKSLRVGLDNIFEDEETEQIDTIGYMEDKENVLEMDLDNTNLSQGSTSNESTTSVDLLSGSCIALKSYFDEEPLHAFPSQVSSSTQHEHTHEQGNTGLTQDIYGLDLDLEDQDKSLNKTETKTGLTQSLADLELNHRTRLTQGLQCLAIQDLTYEGTDITEPNIIYQDQNELRDESQSQS